MLLWKIIPDTLLIVKRLKKKQIPEQSPQYTIIYVNIIFVDRVHLCTCVHIHNSNCKEKYEERDIPRDIIGFYLGKKDGLGKRWIEKS